MNYTKLDHIFNYISKIRRIKNLKYYTFQCNLFVQLKIIQIY